MGKSTRQVYSNHRAIAHEFYIASLLLRLMQPADIDVIAPFFPIELGGDGLFTDNPEFL